MQRESVCVGDIERDSERSRGRERQREAERDNECVSVSDRET